MSRWLLRAGLAVVLGAIVGRANAQESVATPRPIQPVVHEMSEGASSSGAPCATCGSAAPEGQAPKEGNWATRTVNKCLQTHGLGCAASHNSNGCTSCYARLVFVFGSCRQFFTEPCVQPGPDTYPARVPIIPPQIPVPNYVSAVGGGGGGGGCSSCGR
jgi:hypothetical protein